MTPKRETEKKREELQAAADDALTGSVKGSEVRSRKKKTKQHLDPPRPGPHLAALRPAWGCSMRVQHLGCCGTELPDDKTAMSTIGLSLGGLFGQVLYFGPKIFSKDSCFKVLVPDL